MSGLWKEKRLMAALVMMLAMAVPCLAEMWRKSLPDKDVFYPGQTIPEKILEKSGYERYFSIQEIPDTIFRLMQGRSYKSNCTVKRSSLRYLLCLHRDADGRCMVGEMVVNQKIAESVLRILRELYLNHYPIERMRLVDYWNADDEQAMRDNNSSAFNFRLISHTQKVSKHGMGMAIDINPKYNPYSKTLSDGRHIVEPANGKAYLDRSRHTPYTSVNGDFCYALFKKYGFTWGGDWKSCKDYQHFEYK